MRRRQREKAGVANLLLKAPWYAHAALCILSLFVSFALKAALSSNALLPALAPLFDLVGIFLVLVFGSIAAAKLIRLRMRGVANTMPQGVGRFLRRASAHEWNAQARIAAKEKPLQWDRNVIHRMEWKRFEEIGLAWCRARGIRAQSTPLGPDGGVDIRLYENPADPAQCTGIVQCKAWGDRLVGVKPVRELRGVMAHEKVAQGFFMAQGNFTLEARAFAAENQIELIDGECLLGLIALLPPDTAQALLAEATAGDWSTPTCPRCGTKMVERKGRFNTFWGCANYPKCRQQLGMRGA